jgi:hypothetical protein
MMKLPIGDVVVRGSLSQGFIVLDATSRRRLAGPLGLGDALAAAKSHAKGSIWQEIVDDRGRALGLPMKIPLAQVHPHNPGTV